MDEAPAPSDDPNWLIQLLPRLARELATEQFPLEEVLRRYRITREFYDEHVVNNPYFKQVLSNYTAEWQSITSTPRRLAFMAATALEENLPVLASRMGDPRSALADSVTTAKLFRDLAGIAPPAPSQNTAQGDRFSISINFGSHKVAVETQVLEAVAIEEPGVQRSNDAEIPSNPPRIQHDDGEKVLSRQSGVQRGGVPETNSEKATKG